MFFVCFEHSLSVFNQIYCGLCSGFSQARRSRGISSTFHHWWRWRRENELRCLRTMVQSIESPCGFHDMLGKFSFTSSVSWNIIPTWDVRIVFFHSNDFFFFFGEFTCKRTQVSKLMLQYICNCLKILTFSTRLINWLLNFCSAASRNKPSKS